MRPVALVTGTSTGIGAACTTRLAGAGWTVLAGVRRDEDAARARQRSVGEVRPLRLDVTDAGDLEGAAAAVTDLTGDRGLDALVCNAGAAITGPIESITVERWREHLEVNLLGAVATIRVLLPALRRAHGRIVLVGSQLGRVALPGTAPYAAGKHALTAVAEVLRHELRPAGIRVSLVEPGQVRTPLFAKLTTDAESWVRDARTGAVPGYDTLADATLTYLRAGARLGMQPDRVCRRIEHALTSRHPRARYLVGVDARVLGGVVSRLPDRLRDRAVAGTVQAYAWAGRGRA